MAWETNEWYAPALAATMALTGVALAVAAFWVRRWPSVPGTIDISIYHTALSEDGDDAPFGRMTLYLSYSYTVRNRDYAGSHVSPAFLASVRPDKRNSELYRERMKVTVY